jgi:hypothetical protein
MPSQPLEVDLAIWKRYSEIAQNAQWLLDHGYYVGGPELTQQRYYFLLVKRGLATEQRITGIKVFQNEFRSHFPAGLLARLHSELPDTRHNWLAQLVRPNWRPQHPLRHLLLLDYFWVPGGIFAGAG